MRASVFLLEENILEIIRASFLVMGEDVFFLNALSSWVQELAEWRHQSGTSSVNGSKNRVYIFPLVMGLSTEYYFPNDNEQNKVRHSFIETCNFSYFFRTLDISKSIIKEITENISKFLG